MFEMNKYDYLVDNENSSDISKEGDTEESNMVCSSWQDDLEDMCYYKGYTTCEVCVIDGTKWLGNQRDLMIWKRNIEVLLWVAGVKYVSCYRGWGEEK